MSCLSRLVVLSVVSLAAASCSVNLQHDLTENDANDIYVLLQKKSIDATKIKEGEGKDARYVISVPKADVATAAELLREHSLPRPKSEGLSAFRMGKGMIPTQTEERAMLIEALGGEVSNALNKIPGVLEVHTIVNVPENNDLTQPDKKPPTTASVVVKYMPQEGRPPVPPDEVSAFVAGAVPELRRENVKVIMTEAKFVTEVSEEPRLQRIIGVNVDRASAGTFKTIIGVFALLFLAMAGATGFLLVRKPASRPTRSRSQPQQEG